MKTILIADDNVKITDILKEYVQNAQYKALVAHDGFETLEIFKKANPDLILLDVMMPKLNGFEICKKIRETSTVPIIMITARGEDFDKIMGLDIGADDYIVKPFSPSEVMARVRSILRRVKIEEENSLETDSSLILDNLHINFDTYEVFIDKKKVMLTKKEFEIIWLLASNPNKVFSRDNLLTTVWGYEYLGDTRTVDSHITRLRSKLDTLSHPNWDIKTIWGVGYKLEVENV